MKKNIILICLVSIFFSGCGDDFFDQVVDVEIPEHTPALAITSVMKSDDAILLAYVSTSVGVLVQENPPPVTDATVELFKDGNLLYTLPHIEEGVYGWEAPEPLGTDAGVYELKIAKPGFESVKGTQSMPEVVPIIEGSFDEEGTVSDEGDRVDEIIVKFKDIENVANYYQVRAAVRWELSNGGVVENEEYLRSNDPAAREVQSGIYITDAAFDGEEYELKLWAYDVYITSEMINPKLVISLVNTSRDKYFRETSIDSYQNADGNPFAEPAVIFSNIENGYGIFGLEAKGPEFIIDLD